ncbi:MAG: hypothetical protein HN350_21625 [Phycisphaerales bacterium]|jgi:hypothetical protein|nr:hypothetical protein [Phycisphaerales bacterium]
MGKGRIVAKVAVLVLLTFATIVAAADSGRPGERRRSRRSSGPSTHGVQIGQQSTDFELPVLIERTDAKGEKVAVVTTDKIKLSSYLGKKIVCVFMSSYT